jgi:nucleoside-diphosphate-sugar epimerase
MSARPKVLVTGGAGFLGSHLCERLLAEGYSVVSLDNFCTGAPANVAHLAQIGPFRLIRADLTDFVHIVGNPQEITIRDLAVLIRDLAGSHSEITHVGRPEDDPTRRQPDITLARSLIGWEPTVTLEQGLTKTIDWFRSVNQSSRPCPSPGRPRRSHRR